MRMLQFPVGIVDRLDEVGKAGCLVDRPETRKTVTQQLDFPLGE